MNRLAVEKKSERLAWEYDKHIWNEIEQKLEWKEEGVDVRELMTKVIQNDVDSVAMKVDGKDQRAETMGKNSST